MIRWNGKDEHERRRRMKTIEFRYAKEGENVLDYMDEMWMSLVEKNAGKIIGKHGSVKIELIEEKEK